MPSPWRSACRGRLDDGRTTFHLRETHVSRQPPPRDWSAIRGNEKAYFIKGRGEAKDLKGVRHRYDSKARLHYLPLRVAESERGQKILAAMGLDARPMPVDREGRIHVFPPGDKIAELHEARLKKVGPGELAIPAGRVENLSADHQRLVHDYSSGTARRAWVDRLPSTALPAGRASAHVRYILRLAPAADDHVGYITRSLLSAQHRAHAIAADEEGEIVITNLGSLSQVVDFFQQVEKDKRVNGRIQSRQVIELPYELGPNQWRAIVRDYCDRLFRQRHLGHLAVVHLPDVANGSDNRNVHVHILFYDRRMDGTPGDWRFGLKDRTARGPRWILECRKTWAELCQREQRARLRAGQADQFFQLFDHRSYRQLGIPRRPQTHLGRKRTALERVGIPTRAGVDAANRALDWQRLESQIEAQNVRTWVGEIASRSPDPRHFVDAANQAIDRGLAAKAERRRRDACRARLGTRAWYLGLNLVEGRIPPEAELLLGDAVGVLLHVDPPRELSIAEPTSEKIAVPPAEKAEGPAPTKPKEAVLVLARAQDAWDDARVALDGAREALAEAQRTAVVRSIVIQTEDAVAVTGERFRHAEEYRDRCLTRARRTKAVGDDWLAEIAPYRNHSVTAPQDPPVEPPPPPPTPPVHPRKPKWHTQPIQATRNNFPPPSALRVTEFASDEYVCCHPLYLRESAREMLRKSSEAELMTLYTATKDALSHHSAGTDEGDVLHWGLQCVMAEVRTRGLDPDKPAPPACPPAGNGSNGGPVGQPLANQQPTPHPLRQPTKPKDLGR